MGAPLRRRSGSARRSQSLIGAVEECAWPLDQQRRRIGLAPDGALSESSHWLFVDQDAARPLATVQWVRRYDDEATARAALAREGLAPFAPDDDAVHSGHRTAQRICGFIESGAGSSLLHVSSGPAGCYAVYVTR